MTITQQADFSLHMDGDGIEIRTQDGAGRLEESMWIMLDREALERLRDEADKRLPPKRG